MPKLRRRFTKEEKLQIVHESLEENIDLESIAERYSIHRNTIGKWRRDFAQHKENAFPGNGKKRQSAEEREIEQLRKQLRESELANEILKKALGIISSPNRKSLLS